eukprot:1158342-Pelagomonas_calceolata.AAC.9
MAHGEGLWMGRGKADFENQALHPLSSSSATVMLRSPGQARGGRQQGGGPLIESLWPGWR